MRRFILTLFIATLTFQLFGQINTDERQEENDWRIVISNNSSQEFEAMVISASPAFVSEEGQISVPAGESYELRIINQEPESGDQPDQLYLRLISDHPDNPGILTPGKVVEKTNDETTNALISYFYTPDCHKCREFLDREIPKLEEKLGRAIILDEHDVTTPQGLRRLMDSLSEMGSKEKRLPVIIGKGRILAGDREIEEGLEELILSETVYTEQVEEKTGSLSLSLFPILLAGLLDGINPCAFSTLIFLLSWLGLAGRSRKEILITGIFFTLAVFATYYAVGLGAFGAVRSSGSISWINLVLKYLMAAVLLVLAVLHVLDYRKIKQGRISEITLQLSKERKKKIHSIVRENTRRAGLFTGSLLLGVAVTIYELGCTGQVYLPTLMYMTRMEKQLSAFFLLGVYNLAFVLPLIAVFAMAWKGMGSDKLARWFTANVGRVKILSAFFFLLMAGLLIIL